ncbi:MAG: glycosyltransferase family A protein [Gammaproteobacteria bacterium]|jgi:glycosyltransferase involved in cell wall biosynthesis
MSVPFHISVVIPTFNRAGLLETALKSVFAQSLPPHEVIVVDDGSSDDTHDQVMATFGAGVRYHRQPNRGVSAARNAGIQQATGSWIAFLDSDDAWLPNKLQQQVEALQCQPHYRFCHTDEIWFRRGVRVNPMKKHQKTGGHIFERCLPICVISPSSVLIQRDCFDEMGLFDESLPACEDYDYWLRYCARYPVLYVDKPLLIKNGGHADQLSRRYWGMDRFRIQALLNLLDSGCLTSVQQRVTRKMLDEKCSILENGARKHGNREMLAFCDQVRNRINRFSANASTGDAIAGGRARITPG